MPNNKLNHRLLVWTLGVFLVFCLAAHFLHGFQVAWQAKSLKAQAEQTEAKEDFPRAAAYWSRYLVFAPEDTDAQARYAMLLDRLAVSSRARMDAIDRYKKILAREPGRADVRHKLAVLEMSLGFYAEAGTHLEFLVRSSSGRGELEALLGQCREGQGEHQLAMEAYEKAIEGSPDRVASYVALASVLRYRLFQPDKADQVMNSLVERNPRSHAAFLERALYRLANGSVDGAVTDLGQAEKLAPKDAQVLSTAARLALQQGDVANARRFWQRGVENHPRDWQMYLGLAELEAQCGNNAAAAACLQRGVKLLPDNLDLRSALADALIRRGSTEEASKLIEEVRQRSAAMADLLEARILIRNSQWLAAARTLEGACAAAEGSPTVAGRIYLDLGQCYERMNESDRAIVAFEKAVACDASAPAARLKLSAGLLDGGKIEQAVKTLRELTRLPGAPRWTLLGRALLQQALRAQPGERDWAEVQRVLDRAGQFSSEIAPATILQADALMAQDKPDRARERLEAARGKVPAAASPWVALANLASRQGDPNKARTLIREARRTLGPRFELCVAEIEQAVRQDEKELARSLTGAEKDLAKLAPEEQVSLLGRLAECYSDRGDFRQAERLCRQLLRSHPADLRGLLLHFDVSRQSGQEKMARGTLAEIHRLEGEEGTWWRYGEVMLLLGKPGDQATHARARKLVDEIGQRRPGWSRVPLLLAYLAREEGQAERSLEYYLKAITLGERRTGIVLATAQMLAERGRYTEADQVVGILQGEGALARGVARMAAVIALKARKTDRALALARQAVSPTSSDYRDWVWLGQLLADIGRPTEAEETLRRAVQLGSAMPDAWVALARFLSEIGKVEKARSVIDEAARRVSPKQASLTLAECYDALGDAARAEEHYRAALDKAPNDFMVLTKAARFYLRLDQPAKAEPHLRSLLASDGFVPLETTSWARRELALLLVARDPGKEKAALALLDQNGPARKETVADRRARDFIRASQKSQRARALRDLEDSIPLQVLAPEDEFRLARCLELENDERKAEGHLLSLLKNDPRNTVYLTHYIAGLLRRGEAEAARVWLVKLERVEPGSSRTRDLRAKIKELEAAKAGK